MSRILQILGMMIAPELLSSPFMRELERQAWTSEDLDGAENEIVRVIQDDPFNSQAFSLLAHVYLRRFSASPDQLLFAKMAADLAQQSIDLADDQDFGYVALADALDSLGRTDAAAEVLGQMNDPTWRYYFMLARLRTQQDQEEEVMGLLRQALAFREADSEIIVPYVAAMIHSTSHDVLGDLNDWNQKFPHYLFDQEMAARYTELKQFVKAEALYSKVIAGHPEAILARLNRAILWYEHLGRFNKAVREFEALALQVNDNPRLKDLVTLHLAASVLASKQPRRAQQIFQDIGKRSSDETQLLRFMVQSYRRFSDAKELMSALESLQKHIRPSANYYGTLADVAIQELKNYPLAAGLYDDAMIVEPSRSDWASGKGLALFYLGQYPEAADLFRDAIRLNPGDASSIYNLGCALSLMGKYNEALGALEEAFAIDADLQQLARKDPDLKALREHPDFLRLMEAH